MLSLRRVSAAAATAVRRPSTAARSLLVVAPVSARSLHLEASKPSITVRFGIASPANSVASHTCCSLPLPPAQAAIETEPVIVFSKTHCPFCSRVKELFADLDVKHEVIELDVRGACFTPRSPIVPPHNMTTSQLTVSYLVQPTARRSRSCCASSPASAPSRTCSSAVATSAAATPRSTCTPATSCCRCSSNLEHGTNPPYTKANMCSLRPDSETAICGWFILSGEALPLPRALHTHPPTTARAAS